MPTQEMKMRVHGRFLALSGALALVGAGVASPVYGQCCDSMKAETGFDISAMKITESRANTFTHTKQGSSSIAADSKGHLFAVWDSRRQELNTFGVFGQMFDALGRPIGTEIHINDYVPAGQQDPAVIFDSEDRAWVTWDSNTQDGDRLGVCLRRFGTLENGEFGPLGTEVIVNETTAGLQFNPSLAVNASGDVLVTWSTMDDATHQVRSMGRLYAADGTPKTGEFTLSQESDARADRLSSVTALADGQFMTVWARTNADGSIAGLFARVFTNEGEATGTEFPIHDADGLVHIEPSVTSDDSGRVVIAWLRSRAGQGYDAVARRFNADGSAAGDTFVVADDTSLWQSGVAVALEDQGRFIISWNAITGEKIGMMTQRPQASANVLARVFEADGTALGEVFQVNQFAEGRQALSIASNSNRLVWGEYDQLAFVWNGTIDGDKSGVGVTVFAPESLDRPAPPVAERLAAATDLLVEDMAPPVAFEDYEPPEPIIGIQGVGPDFGFIGYQTTEWQPPDPDLAVGPNHIVSVVNMRIKVQDKQGNELFHEYLETFWWDLGARYFVFDPVAQYDPHADRFVVASAEHEGGDAYASHLDIAISKTSNPMDGWHKYRFPLSSVGAFLDFENLSIGTDAYYIAADYFSGGGNNIHMFEKAPMLVGDPVTMKHVQTVDTQISLGAMDNWDTGAPAQYFISSYSGSSTKLTMYAIRDPNGSPQLDRFDLTVPYFTSPPDADQMGTSIRLWTIDHRVKHGVYRNERLYLAHTTGEDNTARVRWYEVDPQGWPASGSNPVLVQSGTLNYGAGKHNFFPDISVDPEGDLVLTYSQTSSEDYPYISRAVRKPFDPQGTFRASVRLQESEGPFTNGSRRWGDYSGNDADPAEPGVVWSHNEYNTTGGSWYTWVGRIDTDQSIVLEGPATLTRGQNATFTMTGCAASGNVYLIYSLVGEGSQYVPQLDITIDLQSPQLAATGTADADGTAVITRRIPNNTPLGPIHLQGAEFRNSSNLLIPTVQ